MPVVVPGGGAGLIKRGTINIYNPPVFTTMTGKIATIRTLVFLLHNPLFSEEGPELYAKAFQHNKPFATAGPYQTALTSKQEQQFLEWVKRWKIDKAPSGFDVSAKLVDYDMRGFWLASHGAPHRPGDHFPDTFKTPYDTTFSAESKYATRDNPFHWDGNNLVDTRTGALVFGETKFKRVFVVIPQVVSKAVMSSSQAIQRYQQTGRHYGWFDSARHAQTYAELLHKAQAAFYMSHKKSKSRFRRG